MVSRPGSSPTTSTRLPATAETATCAGQPRRPRRPHDLRVVLVVTTSPRLAVTVLVVVLQVRNTEADRITDSLPQAVAIYGFIVCTCR